MILTPELDTFITRMPKVELHVHLEGAMAPRTLLELAQQNNVEIPAVDVSGVEQLFQYRDFGEFLTVFMILAQAIVRGEDFERLGYELGCDLAAQNTLYAEVMLSAMQHLLRGMSLHEAIAGTAAGFARAQRETGIEMRIALDYGRQYGPDLAWYVLEVARENRHHGVVAFSIGGNEIGYPPERFGEIFTAAGQAGLRLMAHAGEVAGPESIWGAVDVLGCERLGHGIRSVDDPALIEHLRRRGVTLDVCPTSNIRTGAASSWQTHAMRQLYDAGVAVTINSDDPTFFHTTLTEEYRRAVQYFGFGVDDLCRLVRNAVQATFLPPTEKAALSERVDSELAALRAELGL